MREPTPRPTRACRSIQRVIAEHPGIHFRGLCREADVSSAGQLRHHLDRLVRRGVIVEVPDGRYRRYFLAGAHDPRLRPIMARFARDVPHRIARLLLERPMSRTALRRRLGCADSTLGAHLNRMVQLGDLTKHQGPNCCRYSLVSRDLVRLILEQEDGPSASAAESRSEQAEFLRNMVRTEARATQERDQAAAAAGPVDATRRRSDRPGARPPRPARAGRETAPPAPVPRARGP